MTYATFQKPYNNWHLGSAEQPRLLDPWGPGNDKILMVFASPIGNLCFSGFWGEGHPKSSLTLTISMDVSAFIFLPLA